MVTPPNQHIDHKCADISSKTIILHKVIYTFMNGKEKRVKKQRISYVACLTLYTGRFPMGDIGPYTSFPGRSSCRAASKAA